MTDLYRCITEKGMRPPLPCSCPGYLAAYLQKCWATLPKDRPPFSEICRMLRHLKGLLIRAGSDDNFLFSSVKDIDLEEMAKHLGVKWCIDEILKCGDNDKVRLLRTASKSKVFASNREFKRKLVKVGDHFANWRGTKHKYCLAAEMFSIGGFLRWPRANWKLGLLYEFGLGVPMVDEEYAVRLYHEDTTASASVELGRCFKMGIGVKSRDNNLASFHFKKAVDRQNKSGKAIQCVVELIDIVANGSDEELYDIACKRLSDLSTLECEVYFHSYRHWILAGPNEINIKTLIDALANPRTLDNRKYIITKLLHEVIQACDFYVWEDWVDHDGKCSHYALSIIKAGGVEAVVQLMCSIVISWIRK
ncbi:hypothetical protein O6H91_05G053100 [Diphasiastrum complanatum]|nr:hypothetical protein O6H91_05G053100 [Diphasiastrum complanatum]